MNATRTTWCQMHVVGLSGKDLLAQAKARLGIYGGMSHSIDAGPNASISFDPATVRGEARCSAILDFAAEVAGADGIWRVEFGGA